MYRSFSQFIQESTSVTQEMTPVYQVYLEEIRSIEEWLNEMGVEILSSNSYYRPNDQPYTYIKFFDGSYILIHLMYGEMDYEYYAAKASLPTVKTGKFDKLEDFLKQIRPLLN